MNKKSNTNTFVHSFIEPFEVTLVVLLLWDTIHVNEIIFSCVGRTKED
jgi:hypothetical protein